MSEDVVLWERHSLYTAAWFSDKIETPVMILVRSRLAPVSRDTNWTYFGRQYLISPSFRLRLLWRRCLTLKPDHLLDSLFMVNGKWTKQDFVWSCQLGQFLNSSLKNSKWFEDCVDCERFLRILAKWLESVIETNKSEKQIVSKCSVFLWQFYFQMF